MGPRRRSPVSSSRLAQVLALASAATTAACGDDEGRCGPLGRLCADNGRWLAISPRVDDALRLDLDGDGAAEHVVLDRNGEQLAVSRVGGHRTTLFLTGHAPMAIAALDGEVAVALSRPPTLAIFDLDDTKRLVRRRDLVLPEAPVALVASDLAGDGAPELVLTMPRAQQIAVIDADLTTMREYAAGGYPLQLDVGDVDGDGHLDVVVVDTVTGLQVLRGTGDGSLRKAVVNPVSAQTMAAGIDLADHDGDGDLDAFTRVGRERVLVHRNNGDGGFSTPIALPLDGVSDGLGLVVGPIAGSGLVGVGVPVESGLATWFGKGSVWLGRVDEALESPGTWVGAGSETGMLAGGFGLLRRYAYLAAGTALEVWRSETMKGSVFTSALATGHLDGDHLLDVAAVNDGSLTMLRGRADRGLDLFASFGFAGEPVAMAIADVTGDGKSDVLVSEETGVWLAQATEDGDFVLHPPYTTRVWPYTLLPLRTGPDTPAAIVVIPVTEAGVLGGPGTVLLRFDADGAVTEELDLVGEGYGLGGAAVDFDEDGVDELLLYGREEETMFLAHMPPAGNSYVAAATHDLGALANLPPEAFRTDGFAVGDLDGDARVEAVVSVSQAVVSVTGLVEGAPAATVVPEILAPRHLRDLDGDGNLDAATAPNFWSFLYYRGRGDGTFDPEPVSVDFVDGTAIAFASVPDAQFDLVNLSRSAIATHLMRPVVRPVVAGGVSFHGPVDEFVIADVDDDGSDDVVTASRALGGGVGVWWGGEDDALARADGHVSGRGSRGLAVADLDDDGTLEAIATNSTGDIDAYPLSRQQPIEPIRLLEVGDEVQSLAIADVDGDGSLDLVGLVSLDGVKVVAVARGVAPLQFAAFASVAEFEFGVRSTLELGDVGGDGDLDILVRATDATNSAIILADAPGEWAEVVGLRGVAAMFSPPNAAGRVELVTQVNTSINRHHDGDRDRISLLLDSDTLTSGLLVGVADVDRDGRYDLAVIDEAGTHVWLRRKDELTRVTLCDLRLSPLAFPDVDGDGRRDLVGTNDGRMFVRTTRP